MLSPTYQQLGPKTFLCIDGSPTVDNKCKTSFDTSDKIVDNHIPIDSDEQEQTEKRKLFGCPICTSKTTK